MRQPIRRALLALAASCAGASGAAAQEAPATETPRAGYIIPRATLDDTLEIAGETVDAEARRTRMIVPVRINGAGPFDFLVDSGADRSVIGAALAERLALPPGNPVILHSMAGSRQTRTAELDTLGVGTAQLKGLTLPVLPERGIGAQGVLGIDALVEQRMLMDFAARRVTFQEARRPMLRAGPDEIVVTAYRRRGQLILTQASVGNVPVAAVIDTGAEVTIGNSALAAKLFARGLPRGEPTLLTSVTGEPIPATRVTVPRIRIGSLQLRNVTLSFADVAPFRLFALDNEPAILLGTDVLEAFRRVALDFRNRRVRFTLRR